MTRRIVLATGLSLLACSVAANIAFARTATVGQLFTPSGSCGGPFTYLETTSPSNIPYVIPFTGVITSWTWNDGATPITDLKLKVGHAVSGGQFVIDGEAPAGTQTPNTATAYPANVPVQAGDVIGITQNGGSCAGVDAGYAVTAFTGDIPPSSTPLTPTGVAPNQVLPVQATVTESNSFTFGAITRNKKKGTALLTVNLPNPGELTGSGSGAHVASSDSRAMISKAVPAGAAQLLIKATGKKKRKLNETGKVKLSIAVTYTPTGDTPNTQSAQVKLKKKL